VKESENIYDKIKELFGSIPGSFSILEEKVDIDLQMEYFEFSKRIKKNLNETKVLEESVDLFDEKVTHAYKKELLAQLASIERVDSFRIIEKFLKTADNEIRDWAILALQESKMLLESKFLDENQVFISTGLGGKGDKLRYFVVVIGKKQAPFSKTQQKIIRNEFELSLKKYDGEIEELTFSESLASMLTVLPMDVIIKNVFDEAILECNQFGNFLLPNFIITNVKKLSFNEIRKFLREKQNQSQDISDIYL